MPDVTLPWNGQKMFAPDRGEHLAMLRETWDAHERARQRAKKRIEITVPIQPAATSVFVGQATGNNTANGPEEGYVWSLKLVGITLAGTGTLTVYKASASGDVRRPLWATGTGMPVQVATWSSDQARIRHGEGIYVVGSANLTSVYLAAWEVPAEMEAEIYD
jgi:hypothetical protein